MLEGEFKPDFGREGNKDLLRPSKTFLGDTDFSQKLDKLDLSDYSLHADDTEAHVFPNPLKLNDHAAFANPKSEYALESGTSWGKTTDPHHHDSAQFRYLVHGINEMAQTTQSMMHLQELIDSPDLDLSEQQGDQTINLVSQPERVADRVSLSMSLIDQDHPSTWGDGGLILDVPGENILMTGESDLGTSNSNMARIRERSQVEPKIDPDSLLSRTTSSYNEVVAQPRTESGEVAVQGFFVKVGSDGKPLKEDLAQRLGVQARRLGLPLVRIEEPSLFAKDQVDIVDTLDSDPKYGSKRVAVNLGKKGYLLSYESNIASQSDNPKWRFTRMEERDSRFMAPDEMNQVADYLRANAPEVDTDEIEREYNRADAERQQPKITFAEDGSIQRISRKTGYKNQEREAYITSAGYSGNITLDEQKRIIEKTLLDSRSEIRIDPYPVMSPYEAQSLVTLAKGSVDPEVQAKLDTFWEQAEEQVTRSWEWYQRERDWNKGTRYYK